MKITEEMEKRIDTARTLSKWGHLETWWELGHYMRKYATDEQYTEIMKVFKRKNAGENITLPYMNYIAFSTLGEKK